jgi:hypothetical protein
MHAPAYSSLEAFLAHYRALRGASHRDAGDDRQLAAMSALIEQALDNAGRAALDAGSDSGAARRHRERALLKLRRALIRAGVLTG